MNIESADGEGSCSISLDIISFLPQSLQVAYKPYWKHVQSLSNQVRRNLPIICFGNSTRDAGQCVAIATQTDGQADSILEVAAFKESNDRLRDCALTAAIERVAGTDVLAGAMQVIAIPLFDIGGNLFFRAARTCLEESIVFLFDGECSFIYEGKCKK